MGAKRSGITESDELDYRAAAVEAAARAATTTGIAGPDRRDMEKTARRAAGGPQPLQDRGAR